MTPGAIYETAAKSYGRPRNVMWTRETPVETAVSIAVHEELLGHHVVVCCYCETAALKLALFGMPNVSHGCCDPCLKREMAKMEAQLGAQKARTA